MDGWDPQEDDYQCQKFNTYDRGPGQFLPSKIERSKVDGIQLYITGIPNDMTEDGLYNLFSQAGKCLSVKKCVSKNPDAGDTFGFITMGSVADADKAMAKYNNFGINRFKIRVKIAMSDEDMKKRRAKRLEDEEIINSIVNQRVKMEKAGTGSDTDSSGSRPKNNVNGKVKTPPQNITNGHGEDREGASRSSAGKAQNGGGYPGNRPGLLGRAPVLSGLGIFASAPGVFGPIPPPFPVHYGGRSNMLDISACNNSENSYQGPARERDHFGGPRRGRGGMAPWGFEEDMQQGERDYWQGSGYGRGYAPGPFHSYPRRPYRGGGHFNHQGYGRGQHHRGSNRGSYGGQAFPAGYFHGPQSNYRHGSMESLASTPSRPKIETRPCAHCETPGNFQCSKCKTPYCSPDCQKTHWSDHKEVCGEICDVKKKIEKEDDTFGEISIGNDIIQKMIVGGALTVEPKPETKASKESLPQVENPPSAGPAKKSPPQVEKPPSAGPAKKSPPQADKPESAGPKGSGKRGDNEAKPMAVPVMVPLQVQKRAEASKMKSPVPSQTSAPAQMSPQPTKGKRLKISELPIGSDMQVCVSEVITPAEVWLQPFVPENMQAVAELMVEMKTLYSASSDYVKCPVVGDVYGAQFTLDDDWYRARVDALQGSGKVMVTYLDYGNKETLTTTRLRQLADNMVTVPALAVECSLADICQGHGGWGGAVELLLSLIPPTMTSGRVYSANAHSKLGDKYVVSMMDNSGEDIGTKLVAAGVVEGTRVEVKNLPPAKVNDASASPLLPYSTLPLNEMVQVLTVDVSSPGEIWVQGDLEKIECSMEVTAQINTMVSNQKLSPATEVRVGEMYCAFCAKDACWYRAKIDLIRQDGTYTITYIDFGNKENVSLSQIKELGADMKAVPLTGIHCVLDGVAPLPGEKNWSDAAINALKELVTLTEETRALYTAKAVGATPTTTCVTLADAQGNDIAEKLVEAGVVQKCGDSAANSHPKDEPAAPVSELKRISVMAKSLGNVADTLKPNDPISIMITDVTSPVEFVIQLNLEHLIRPFVAFSEKVNKALNGSTGGYKPTKVGELVLGLYEGAWYRAEVLNIGEKAARVRYIDFGNTELQEYSSMSEAMESCDSLPAQSVRSCLHGITVPDAWPENILGKFVQLTADPLDAEFKFMSDNVAMIDILIGAKKVSVSSTIQQELQKISEKVTSPVLPKVEDTSKVAAAENKSVLPATVAPSGPIMADNIAMEPLPRTFEEAAITAIEDFESFYLQLTKMETKITETQDNVSAYCNSIDTPYTPVKGELICAKFSIDGKWYRAKVLDILEEDRQFRTQFVDYGNCESVDAESMRQMNPSLATLSCQGIYCKMCNVTNEGQTRDTLAAFAQIVGTSKVQVAARSLDGGIYSVLLTTPEGIDLNTTFATQEKTSPMELQLSPHPEAPHTGTIKLTDVACITPQQDTVDLIITYVESPDEFYCQLFDVKNIEALTLLLQNIMLHCEMGSSDATFRPEIGDLCCAFFKDDGSWYRAVVTKTFQDNTLQVHFVDFGNRETVSRDHVRRITAEYAELPILAFKCSLKGVRPLGASWSCEASDKLKTYYNQRITAQVVERQDDVFVLELSVGDGVNLSNHLVDAGFAQKSQVQAQEAAGANASPNMEATIKEQIAALQAQLQAMHTNK